ncbi:MAG TPA: Fic family protein, partial [Candidatus Brocadiia bacterium]|nr:Fic family protein [Candidatus Brocadiia bacterium]
ERRLRFKPASAKETPGLIERLCANYGAFREGPDFPPLLTVATFVFDFLCIHPFRDGNGRVARLLTTFLLLGHGFQVGRYISLERLVEESKDEYYRSLAVCSKGWREGANEVVPWWNYFLSVLSRAYREFSRKVESVEARPAKSNLVRGAALAQVGPFTLADLAAQFPAASPQLIKKVLAEMKNAGEVRLVGRGRGARWEALNPR